MTSGGRRPSGGGGRGRRGGGSGRVHRLGPPPPGLFHDIVLAPDRERVPEANPVVSVGAEDDAEYLRELERRWLAEFPLRRRGVDLGTLVELKPEGLLPPRLRRRRREAIESERWVAARPVFLPELARDVVPGLARDDLSALHASLAAPDGLRALLAARAGRLAPAFEVSDEAAAVFDPERDVARVTLRAADGSGDLWLKAGRLSTHADDASLRLRVSFGVEGDDDASRDEARHRAVGELATRLVPGARALLGLEELNAKLERHTGAPVLLTQHIAYWNAPDGGARFHHDAFAEDADGAGQRGVAYAQLTGRTLWLALSIEDLAARLREFVSWLAQGDMPWLREALEPARWEELTTVVARRASCLAEAAKPGCGVFGAFVDGPEFTRFLADAGYALVLRPGDVLLLPNHGLDRTAMHSVFSASEEPGYALSVAIHQDPSRRGSPDS